VTPASCHSQQIQRLVVGHCCERGKPALPDGALQAFDPKIWLSRGCHDSAPKQAIPRFKDQPLGAVLAELAYLVVFEHAEGFAGVIGAHHIGGVENVAQLIAAEAEEMDIEGIEFGAQQRSAFGFENEG